MKDQLIKKGKDLLDEQLQAYGLGGMSGQGSNSGGNSSAASFSSLGDGLNRYQLAIDGLNAQLSVLSVQGHEHLSETWQYDIQFTAQHGLTMEQVLSEKAVFTLAPGGISSLSGAAGQLSNELMSAFNAFGGMFSDKIGSASNSLSGGFSINSVSQMASRGMGMVNQASSAVSKLGGMANSIGGIAGRASGLLGKAGSSLSSLGGMASSLAGGESETRILYGVVTAFSQLSGSADEARYSITLSPRLALLDNSQNSAIFQNQTVPQVVEQVLRQHEMTGVDFRFELTETYPVKEYITQWQESDLTFIRRLLADSGIWFSFETHTKHSCDVVVFGDSEQQYQDGPTASYRQPSGNNDNGVESVWDMSVARKTVPQSVLTQDYNYRNAQTGMKSEVNGAQKDKTTRGQHYVYGEHYRDKGEVVNHANAQDDLLGQFSNMMPNGLGDIPGVSQLSGVAGSVSGAVSGVTGGIAGAAGQGASLASSTLSPTGIAGGASGAGIGDMASSAAGSVGSAVSSAAGSAVSGVTGAVQNMAGQAKGAFDSVGSSLSGLSDKGGDLLNGLNDSEAEDGASDEPEAVGQGAWYARLRHQRFMTEQITISGKTTLSHLAPGQILTVSGSPIAEAGSGILIVSVETQGDRQQAYVISFTGIPYDVLRPYRPARLVWPTISGTLPARVTSPDNDTYSYIDAQGRYRVKMDFDLNDNWRKGEESLWMRLAKAYAGETYGIHFPLIDGTEVAIAFTEGNPDRPYIAHAMHDSRHGDVVTVANHKRNVIRTPANNKLRMDDERGKEHIKVATEYGKTQLNMGHLVDAERKQRGEGFELRTDEWGAIRAGKGLYITSEEKPQAEKQQLTMDNVIAELEQAHKMVEELNKMAAAAKAELADIQAQNALLQSSLNSMKGPSILSYAPAGIASVTPTSIQQTAGENIIHTAQNTVDISAFKRFMVTAGDVISLFASKMGIKIFAAKGKLELQAQDDEMDLTSKQNMVITSTDNEVIINAKTRLTLACDGAAIVLEGGSITVIGPGDIKGKVASFNIIGPESYSPPKPELPAGASCSETA
ncbi:type VI secretion system tip protein VgrG [Budviciaceae bacterium BWR-B9]|uniref:Type VI secretion system tip protein VgrG n=1 Tax=Limnobaculum allomyrinae TaxID=2791986 RepID=A0ABS1IKS0_9GAMM|nr:MULTISPECIES: type VI secretion system Vgr family protein [Limnobaculum]MBK5142197.1 type VI secretion system tip protein VgrG [Limnobaculum allomyrinae]MBV7690919.1 type VI secretion system tip protein VgrG [Limnobaculum sp. M2-1]